MYPYQDSQPVYSDDETQRTRICQIQEQDPWVEAMQKEGSYFLVAHSCLHTVTLIVRWIVPNISCLVHLRLYSWPYRREGPVARPMFHLTIVIIRCRLLQIMRMGDQHLQRRRCRRLSRCLHLPVIPMSRLCSYVYCQQHTPHSDLT